MRTPGMWLRGGFALTICSFSAVGCGGSQSKGPNNAASGNAGGSAIAQSRCEESGKRVVTGDLNHDSKPDVWKFYTVAQQGGQDVQILNCKEVDLNQDGKIDMVDHYDAAGALAATEFDLDFDGRFDKTYIFQNGKRVRAEQDLDFDGKANQFEYYEGDKLARVEIDSNGDNKIDVWQYYENGKLDRIGYDTTGSGRVDKWERAPEEAAAPGAEAAPPAGGATTPPPAGGNQPPAMQPPPVTAPPPVQPPAPPAK